MGGDGGAKPLGRKYLRATKKKQKGERANKVEVSVAKYTNCALSNETLREPVVRIFQIIHIHSNIQYTRDSTYIYVYIQ